MDKLSYHRLCANNEIDIATVQTVYEASPEYFYIVHGHALDKNTVKEDLIAIPKECSLEAKFFYAIYHDLDAIGCIDVIRGYPNQHTAFIGLLLFIETQQGFGYGQQALSFITQLAHDWKCNRLRIAVVESNQRALSFWAREGFIELYRKETNEYCADVIVMEKQLTV